MDFLHFQLRIMLLCFRVLVQTLLNVLCKKGMHGVLGYTSWNMLLDALNNKRYKSFEVKFNEIIE